MNSNRRLADELGKISSDVLEADKPNIRLEGNDKAEANAAEQRDEQG